jgi:hypothetical protein
MKGAVDDDRFPFEAEARRRSADLADLVHQTRVSGQPAEAEIDYVDRQ